MNPFVRKQSLITEILCCVCTVLFSAGACFLYRKTTGEMVRFLAFVLIYAFFLVFVLQLERRTGRFAYDNAEHPYRFMTIYLIGLSLSIAFPLIDRGGWLYVGIFTALALFSDPFVGMFSGTGLLLISCILSGGELYALAVYFLAGLLGILLFQDIDENFKVSFSIFLSMLALFLLETAGFIVAANEELSGEQFIYPIVNIVINSVILFMALKYFNEHVVNRYRNQYLELNDQEYRELVKLKETSKADYFQSIHTAYLAERIAGACGADVELCKNLAYYHRIPKAFGLSKDQLSLFVQENGFPPEAGEALLKYCSADNVLKGKEECIVFLSDKLMAMLMLVFEKDKKAKIDYVGLIDGLLQKPAILERLDESDLTRGDFSKISGIMKKEVLYYEFLR